MQTSERNRVSFKITHPDLFRYWSPNNIKNPDNYSRKSGEKLLWRCLDNSSHEWEKSLIYQVDDHVMECPFCNSIANDSKLMEYWHPTKNLHLDPWKISRGSNEQIWWRCKFNPDHSLLRSPKRVYRNGGKIKCLLCELKDPCFTYDQTLEARFPELLHEWDYENNDFLPSQVGAKSDKFANWKCRFNHRWSRSISNSTRRNAKNSKTRCPECLNKKVTLENCAATTHPYLLEEWHSDNQFTLYQVTYGSNQKMKWKCLKNESHSYTTTMKHKTRDDPTGCPHCSKRISKGEKECLNFLAGEDGVRNKSLIINDRIFYPDFMLKEYKLIIEYNGDMYHGHPDYYDPHDKSEFGTQTYGDLYNKTFERKEYLENHGWTVIFIWEHEWKRFKKRIL